MLKPQAIHLFLTTKCNLRCRFCVAAGDVNGHIYDMESKMFCKIISEIDHNCFLYFSGGEPLVYFEDREDLYDLVFEKSNALPVFITNLQLIHKQKKLLNHLGHNPWYIKVSAEGVRANYNNARRGADWKRLLFNLGLLSDIRDTNPNTVLSINYIITKNTIEDLFDFVKIMENYNVDMIKVNNLLYSPSAEREYKDYIFEDNFIEDFDFIREKIQFIYEYLEDTQSNLSFITQKFNGISWDYNKDNVSLKLSQILKVEKNTKESYFCEDPLNFMYFNWDGNCSPCCNATNLIMGNCKEDNIYDIFNNTNYQKLRTDLSIGVKPEYCTCANFRINKKNTIYSISNAYKKERMKDKCSKIIVKYKNMLEEDLDKSIEYLEEKEKELYSFDTNSISVWNELAGVYLYRKSDYDNASKYIDKILKLNPNSIQALMKKGIMLVFQNKYKESIDVLNKISLNGTSNDIYYFWMGYAYEKDGNQKLCHEYYSEFLSLSKDENSWGYKHAEEILINQ